MSRILLLAALALAWPQSEPMTTPKVEHQQHQYVITDDEVKRTCPEGYEGHFVDTRTGFDSMSYWQLGTAFVITPEPAYTVCFSKKFMNELRKKPEMLAARPEPPRPI